MPETLAAFVASAVVICTPGQDTALTIRNTLAGGRRSGVATAGGVAIGQAIWTIAASLGVVALLSASEPLALYAVVVARVRPFMAGPARRAVAAFTGVVLVVFGVRLAFAER